jgi:hypothetical protein
VELVPFKALEMMGLVEAVTPLHDGAAEVWRAGKLLSLAPLGALQAYYGPNITAYFAWMRLFTLWLLAPGAVGLALYVHKYFSNYTVDDHPYIPFFSFFMVMWSVLFLGHWQQRSNDYAWEWGVYGHERKERVRPEFRGEVRATKGGRPRRHYYPHWKRICWYAVSALVTSLMLLAAFVVMICSLTLQGYVDGKLWSERYFYIPELAALAAPGAVFDPAQTEYFGALTYIPVIGHVLMIMQLNGLYRRVAEELTAWENHRLEEDHENSIIVKRFCFEVWCTALGHACLVATERQFAAVCVMAAGASRRLTATVRSPSALFHLALHVVWCLNALLRGRSRTLLPGICTVRYHPFASRAHLHLHRGLGAARGDRVGAALADAEGYGQLQ